jgi:hypothetical protein
LWAASGQTWNSIAKYGYDCGSILADLFTKCAKFDASGVACLRCWYRGNKEPAALEDGFREIELSWTVQLFDLKGRGLSIGARLAAGDGALGFWNALAKVYGYTRWQSLDFRYRRAPEGHWL